MDVGWIFKQRGHSQWYLVAKLQAGALSPGRGFQGRVLSFHVEKPGNYSIAISPVVYSDRGIYQCQYMDGTFISEIKAYIFVPLPVSVTMGMSISLPCYGNIDKQLSAVDLDILWKKGEKLVYQLCNNNITYGSGFENRASLSPELAMQGYMSLTINQTLISDGGQYQCFFNSPNKNGYPDSVSLTVTGSNTGMIVGIVVGFLLFILIVAVLLWRKKKCVPHTDSKNAQQAVKRNSQAVPDFSGHRTGPDYLQDLIQNYTLPCLDVATIPNVDTWPHLDVRPRTLVHYSSDRVLDCNPWGLTLWQVHPPPSSTHGPSSGKQVHRSGRVGEPLPGQVP
ncbi:hypothetical protein SKAU_G00384510 [Synaphobranchus kaupii]|uniref:Ig-like domain-containing protein n=1 Tax=Synaphobranchus kaupii TaxID=118154 RepID=A0A9Q1IF37_SYNKA|nr:hypothetical protein SKAU_G00384510 [Synaphobranchus kaupii]